MLVVELMVLLVVVLDDAPVVVVVVLLVEGRGGGLLVLVGVLVLVDGASAVETSVSVTWAGGDTSGVSLAQPVKTTTTASVAPAQKRRRPLTVGIRVRRPRSGGRAHGRGR